MQWWVMPATFLSAALIFMLVNPPAAIPIWVKWILGGISAGLNSLLALAGRPPKKKGQAQLDLPLDKKKTG